MEVNMAENSNNIIDEKKKNKKMKMKMKMKEKEKQAMNQTMDPKITKGSRSGRKREQYRKLRTPIGKAYLLARIRKRTERINLLCRVSGRLSVLAKWMNRTVTSFEAATDPLIMSTTLEHLEIQLARVEMEADRVESELLSAWRRGDLSGFMMQEQMAGGVYCPRDVSVRFGVEAAGHTGVASSSMAVEDDDKHDEADLSRMLADLSKRLADSRLEG